jgi:hypothetical protein
MKRKGYKFFDKGDYNLNLIGIRNTTLYANSYDDILLNIYKVSGKWFWEEFKITTDAGTHYLLNPIVKHKGTALVVPNQYSGLWEVGFHRNKYKALVQKGDVSVYRDNNRDKILDFDTASIEKGVFGINCHRSNPRGKSSRVDKWSAGCQVFSDVSDFELDFMPIIEKAKDKWGNSFTYTLLTKKDLEI